MQNSELWFLYLLYSKSHDVYYVGVTNDVGARLRKHNEGKGAKFTRGRGPWRIEAVISFDTKSEAMREERQAKRCTKEQKPKYFSMLLNKLKL